MIPSVFHLYGIVQLFQIPGYIVVLNEAIHAVRIVPMDGRPHLGLHIRQWKGDSRGRWEGNTLIVETTNFSDQTDYGGRGPLVDITRGANMHLVERFTRVDADTITYEFTVDDPTTFARPWSAAVPMKKTEGPLFEFACHEGNYGLAGMLRAARAEEARPTIEVHGVDSVDAGALVPLEAEAAAHGGARVEQVEFLVDGAVVGVDTAAPYEVTWTAGGPGRHIVSATVHDSAGHVASASATVFVGLRALERSVARSEDDAQEGVDGSITDGHASRVTGIDLHFSEGRGVHQVVGLRFTDIRIPGGAPIAKASVQFTAAEASPNPTDLIIQAELVGNGAPFRDVPRNLTSRRRTAASVEWSPEPWEVAGESSASQRTPDLAAVIQEVVDRPDWREGNALVLLISGSDRGPRAAWSYDRASRRSNTPWLYVELAEPSP